MQCPAPLSPFSYLATFSGSIPIFMFSSLTAVFMAKACSGLHLVLRQSNWRRPARHRSRSGEAGGSSSTRSLRCLSASGGLLSKGKITQDLINMLLSWPPAPLPARRAYRPEGRAYASESVIRVSMSSVAPGSSPGRKRPWKSRPATLVRLY